MHHAVIHHHVCTEGVTDALMPKANPAERELRPEFADDVVERPDSLGEHARRNQQRSGLSARTCSTVIWSLRCTSIFTSISPRYWTML